MDIVLLIILLVETEGFGQWFSLRHQAKVEKLLWAQPNEMKGNAHYTTFPF
jgi:hypothetical protein